jgi:hypothetical protein
MKSAKSCRERIGEPTTGHADPAFVPFNGEINLM